MTWLKLAGTRTNTENAISWEGSRNEYNGFFGHDVNFNNTVTVVDENTRSFVEVITGRTGERYDTAWEISSNIIGTVVEDTSVCKPVAGTVHEIYWSNDGGSILDEDTDITMTTISKEIDDRYWKVVSVENDTDTREYFARELIVSRTSNPDDENFICVFVDH